jgi:hypothetical protein
MIYISNYHRCKWSLSSVCAIENLTTILQVCGLANTSTELFALHSPYNISIRLVVEH